MMRLGASVRPLCVRRLPRSQRMRFGTSVRPLCFRRLIRSNRMRWGGMGVSAVAAVEAVPPLETSSLWSDILPTETCDSHLLHLPQCFHCALDCQRFLLPLVREPRTYIVKRSRCNVCDLGAFPVLHLRGLALYIEGVAQQLVANLLQELLNWLRRHPRSKACDSFRSFQASPCNCIETPTSSVSSFARRNLSMPFKYVIGNHFLQRPHKTNGYPRSLLNRKT